MIIEFSSKSTWTF